MGGVICLSEVTDISPSNLDSSLCSFQPSVSHDVLCIFSILSPKCYFSFVFRKVKVAQSCPTLMEFSRPEHWSGQPSPSPGDLPNPGIEPRSPALRADSLPAEPQGKPKNTGVGCLSLLQVDLPDPGIKLGLLHCRLILYQQSRQGSPLALRSSRKGLSTEPLACGPV